jgi:hypothetical protein
VLVFHLRGFALGLEAPKAHEAVTARDVERDHHAVADLQVGYGRPDLFDNAHRLVAEDVATVEERTENLVEVQVGAADRSRGNPHNCVRRLEDDRIGYGLHRNGSFALIGECTHSLPF